MAGNPDAIGRGLIVKVVRAEYGPVLDLYLLQHVVPHAGMDDDLDGETRAHRADVNRDPLPVGLGRALRGRHLEDLQVLGHLIGDTDTLRSFPSLGHGHADRKVHEIPAFGRMTLC